MTSFKKITGTGYFIISAMILAAILMGIPVYLPAIYPPEHSDFTEHIYYASLIAEGRFRYLPRILSHPLYQFLLAGLYWLFLRRLGLQTIALLVQILAQALLALLIYFWLGREDPKRWNWARAAWAFSLTLVAPIMLFVFQDGMYYQGYIGITSYHNPTTTLAKPIALTSFICLLPIFDASQGRGKTALVAFLTILTALIKPNYLLCILPAAVALAVIYRALKKPVNWRLLTLGLLSPGLLILAGQYAAAYLIRAGDEKGIIFSPLGVMSGYSGYLLPKLILSMLFPLAVLALNFRKAVRDQTLMLAWAGYAAGLAQAYLLAEGGGRLSHGNFIWGAEIMLLILFTASAAFLWREKTAKGSWRGTANIIVLTAYLAHIAAGIAYWAYAAQTDHIYPW